MTDLPGVLDFLVSVAELVACYAIVASFFAFANPDAQNTWWDSFQGEYLVVIGTGLCVVVLCIFGLARCCRGCCSWFRHPKLPASIQMLKHLLFVCNFYYLKTATFSTFTDYDLHQQGAASDFVFSLKTGSDLVVPIGLALFELLLSLNALISTLCGEGKDLAYTTRQTHNNPHPRLSATWIFINLWKDFSIISSFFKVNELYILIPEIPATVGFARRLAETKTTSQDLKYHLGRVFMVGCALLGFWLGTLMTKRPLELLPDKTAGCILIACETVLAGCEIKNGCDNREDSGVAPYESV